MFKIELPQLLFTEATTSATLKSLFDERAVNKLLVPVLADPISQWAPQSNPSYSRGSAGQGPCRGCQPNRQDLKQTYRL